MSANDRPGHGAPSGDAERAARDAVRALARPRAGDAFRARLRHDFVSGRIGRAQGLARPAPWFRRGALLLPLAAGFLVLVGWTLNRGPDWQLAAGAGATGRLFVDGVELTDRAALAARLRRGGHVRLEGARTLDLVAPGVAAVALSPGADLVLSPAPGRWWGRGMRAHLAAGNAYFTTGRGFHGAHLDVSTPEASLRAVGTAFAVLHDEDFTCVCVMEGRVRVATASEPVASGVDVPHGMRRVVHADGKSELAPILDESVHHLHAQRDALGPLLGR